MCSQTALPLVLACPGRLHRAQSPREGAGAPWAMIPLTPQSETRVSEKELDYSSGNHLFSNLERVSESQFPHH